MIWIYLKENKEWIMSGIGIAMFTLIGRLISLVIKIFTNRWRLRNTHNKYFSTVWRFPANKIYLTSDGTLNEPTHDFINKCIIKKHSTLIKKIKKELNNDSLIWLDIDKFTQINNLFGKEYGDIVIDIIIKILFAISQKYNYTIYHAKKRDEFFIIVPGGLNVRDCALESISLIEQYDWAGIVPNMFVTCSAGIAQYSTTPLNTIKKARVSLDLIKSKGGNGVGPEILKLHPYQLVNLKGS